jgi:hypothetical protein
VLEEPILTDAQIDLAHPAPTDQTHKAIGPDALRANQLLAWTAAKTRRRQKLARTFVSLQKGGDPIGEIRVCDPGLREPRPTLRLGAVQERVEHVEGAPMQVRRLPAGLGPDGSVQRPRARRLRQRPEVKTS